MHGASASGRQQQRAAAARGERGVCDVSIVYVFGQEKDSNGTTVGSMTCTVRGRRRSAMVGHRGYVVFVAQELLVWPHRSWTGPCGDGRNLSCLGPATRRQGLPAETAPELLSASLVDSHKKQQKQRTRQMPARKVAARPPPPSGCPWWLLHQRYP